MRLPVFLGRRPEEPADEELRSFYGRLLPAVAAARSATGEWQLGDTSGWPGNESWRNLVAWGWRGETPQALVVVNLGDVHRRRTASRCRGTTCAGVTWELADPTTDARFERSGDELRDGLYVELGAGHWHLFELAALDG